MTTDWLPEGACREAREWVAEQATTPEQCWARCERADWMLWLVARVGVERRLVVEAACDCAETALDYAEPDSLLAYVWAIDAARRYVRGEADAEEVEAARYAAADAAYADAA